MDCTPYRANLSSKQRRASGLKQSMILLAYNHHFLLLLILILFNLPAALMDKGQQANYLSTVAHRFQWVLFWMLKSATVREMAIFWVSCTLGTKRMPFAMMYHNWLLLAENRPAFIVMFF